MGQLDEKRPCGQVNWENSSAALLVQVRSNALHC